MLFQVDVDSYLRWKMEQGVQTPQRVFHVSPQFPGLREALLRRGWAENEDLESPWSRRA